MTFKIVELAKLNETLEKINRQQVNFSIQTAYNLSSLRRTVSQAFSFVVERLHLVLGDNVDFSKLTDTQTVIYENIMNSEIDLDYTVPSNFSFSDIINTQGVQLGMSDVEVLENVFNKCVKAPAAEPKINLNRVFEDIKSDWGDMKTMAQTHRINEEIAKTPITKKDDSEYTFDELGDSHEAKRHISRESMASWKQEYAKMRVEGKTILENVRNNPIDTSKLDASFDIGSEQSKI